MLSVNGAVSNILKIHPNIEEKNAYLILFLRPPFSSLFFKLRILTTFHCAVSIRGLLVENEKKNAKKCCVIELTKVPLALCRCFVFLS